MKDQTFKIDLGQFKSEESHVFTGRRRGEAVRAELDLRKLEQEYERIEVIVPGDTISINNSFFLGLFGESIRDLQEGGFRQKYAFKTNDVIKENIEQGIRIAVKESSVF